MTYFDRITRAWFGRNATPAFINSAFPHIGSRYRVDSGFGGSGLYAQFRMNDGSESGLVPEVANEATLVSIMQRYGVTDITLEEVAAQAEAARLQKEAEQIAAKNKMLQSTTAQHDSTVETRTSETVAKAEELNKQIDAFNNKLVNMPTSNGLQNMPNNGVQDAAPTQAQSTTIMGDLVKYLSSLGQNSQQAQEGTPQPQVKEPVASPSTGGVSSVLQAAPTQQAPIQGSAGIPKQVLAIAAAVVIGLILLVLGTLAGGRK